MIKGGSAPRCRVVALLARLRESRLHMVRIRCRVEILHVAADTIRRCSRELPTDVALIAGHSRVCPSQRKLGERVVIECGLIPTDAVVACLTSRRETSLRMRRIIGLVKVRHVAAHAGRRRATRKLAPRVAGAAIQRGVRSDQRKAGELHVIKLRRHPVVRGVALLAIRGKPKRNVIDARRPGVHKFFLVAGQARSREALELAHSCTLVAGIAIHGRVRSDQREPVHVLIDLLDGNVPATHRMTLLAIGAHLPLVNIGMALGALRPHIREDRLRVALRAGDTRVHATQWILCRVVIELRNRADRLPSAQRVTVLTGNTQATVRAARVGGRLLLRSSRLSAGQQRNCDCQIKQDCRSQGSPNSTQEDFDDETVTAEMSVKL